MTQDPLAREFRQERAVRRATFLLEAKRRRIRADLQQLVGHLSLLMPPRRADQTLDEQQDILESALGRLNDDAFSQLLQQILAEQSSG
ncbi:MAG: hypothetical protein AAGG51_24305 [Cyanobacteria bacterium P01_G01_bin.54]